MEFKQILYESLIYALGTTLPKYNPESARVLTLELGRKIREYLALKGIQFQPGDTIEDTMKSFAATLASEGLINDLRVIPDLSGGIHLVRGFGHAPEAFKAIAAQEEQVLLPCPVNSLLQDALDGFNAMLRTNNVDLDAAEVWQEVVQSSEMPASDGRPDLKIDIYRVAHELRGTNRELTALQIKLERQLEKMVQLHDLSRSLDLQPVLDEILAFVAELSEADLALLFLYDADANELYPMARIGFTEEQSYWFGRIPTAKSASGQAVTLGRDVIIEDVEKEADYAYRKIARDVGYRSIHSMPLISRKGNVLGTVSVYLPYPHRPDSSSSQLLKLYIRQAAQAIEMTQEHINLQAEREALSVAINDLEQRFSKEEERRRAMFKIMEDMKMLNKRLEDRRKAMLHILVDYEKDRSRMARQTERLDNSRRALLHILQDQHRSNLRLESSRTAMIHIMKDLRETTSEIQRREQELRDKQEQLVQAGKLATLGELTTGVAHELNNPLNNIGLFLGNAIDQIQLGKIDKDRLLQELHKAMQQVFKATEIISHLRTFGRAATIMQEPVNVHEVLHRSIQLVQEQFRLRQIEVSIQCPEKVYVTGNSIQIEQVFINILTNAKDALAKSAVKKVWITCQVDTENVTIRFQDSGPGIPRGMEKRIFDPFFTTKEVGSGTGLGLSITYGIIKEHKGAIWVENKPGEGAAFLIQLPLASEETIREAVFTELL